MQILKTTDIGRKWNRLTNCLAGNAAQGLAYQGAGEAGLGVGGLGGGGGVGTQQPEDDGFLQSFQSLDLEEEPQQGDINKGCRKKGIFLVARPLKP